MKSFLIAAYVIGTGFICAAGAHAATPGVYNESIVVGQSALERDGDYLRFSTEGTYAPVPGFWDRDADYLRFSTEGEFKPVLAVHEQDADYLRFSTDGAFVIVQERDEDYLRFSTDGEFVPIFGVVRAAR